VLRNDGVVLERYFEGDDRKRGVGDIGHVAFKPDTLHDLRSCSKSIVGLLYGIALEQGKVPPPETPLYSAFPEYEVARLQNRHLITVQHVLTMTMGTDWDESSLVYSDPRNSETAMDEAQDRYRYILERPIVGLPGTHWAYCGGATALLARLVPAKRCMNSRARTCSIPWAWVRPSGLRDATASRSRPPVRACRFAISPASAA